MRGLLVGVADLDERRFVERSTEELKTGYHGGWQDLLGRRLRSFLETGEKMGIGHEPAAG